MPEPKVVQMMRANKAAILLQEESKMEEMARQWLKIERAIKDELEAVALKAAQMKEDGQVINKAVALRMERMQKLLWQAHAETGKYIQWADGYITEYQAMLAVQGLEQAGEAIAATLDEYGIRAAFDRLNVSAIENMIGLAGDGSPLAEYLRGIYTTSTDGILDALVNGVAQGTHPTKIAQKMLDGFGMGLQQAMNTARTETLRAYRAATLMQYDASGLVSGYKRISARDDRVCVGCLFTDGQFYEDLAQFDEHNQGRCSMVPALKGIDEPQWESAFDWFEQQSATTQESILGTGRFEAWKNGAALKEMVTRTYDPTWGGAYVPTPLKDLK